MPVYLVSILLMWGLMVFAKGGGDPDQLDKMISNIWTNIIYVNNFIPIEEQFMGWCWTCC